MIELNLIIDVLPFLKRISFKKSTSILLTPRIHLTKCDYFCEMKGAFFLSGVSSFPLSSQREKKKGSEIKCTERGALDVIRGTLFLMRLLDDG